MTYEDVPEVFTIDDPLQLVPYSLKSGGQTLASPPTQNGDVSLEFPTFEASRDDVIAAGINALKEERRRRYAESSEANLQGWADWRARKSAKQA